MQGQIGREALRPAGPIRSRLVAAPSEKTRMLLDALRHRSAGRIQSQPDVDASARAVVGNCDRTSVQCGAVSRNRALFLWISRSTTEIPREGRRLCSLNRNF